MSKPKISVIVPVYNVENYIDRCINSIINQTFEDLEIILVDDKSPDGSPQKCDEWGKQDGRIKVIHKSRNEGLGFARNTGLEYAMGEYVTFVDSDDWIDLNMYSDLYSLCKQYNADIIYSGLKRINAKGEISLLPHIDKFTVYEGNEISSILMFDLIASPPNERNDRRIQVSVDTCLFRREIIASNNIKFHSEREIISEDLFFHIDFLPYIQLAIVTPNRYYYYFWNDQSLSSTIRTDRFEKYKTLHTELSKKSHSKIMQQRIDRILIGYTRSFLKKIVTYPIPNNHKISLFKNICNDSIWETIEKRYPTNKMFFIHRIIFLLIANKHYKLLYTLLNLFTK